MRPALALLLALSVATAAPLPFPKPKAPTMTDAESLQGEWAIVSQPGVTVRVKHDRLSFLVSGEVRTSWAFTLDPAQSPKAMDLRLVEAKGGGKCESLLALYHVERDTLLITYGTHARPSGLDVKKPEGWDYVCKRKR